MSDYGLEVGELIVFTSEDDIYRDAIGVMVTTYSCRIIKSSPHRNIETVGNEINLHNWPCHRLDPNNEEHMQVILEHELQKD